MFQKLLRYIYIIYIIIYISSLTTSNFLYAQESGIDNLYGEEIAPIDHIGGIDGTGNAENDIENTEKIEQEGTGSYILPAGDVIGSGSLSLGSGATTIPENNMDETSLKSDDVHKDNSYIPQNHQEPKKQDIATQIQLESDLNTIFINDTRQFLKYIGSSIIPNNSNNGVIMHQNFVFSSPVGNIQALITKDTQISTSDKKIFNLAGFGIEEGSKQLIKKVEVVDSEGNVIIKDIEQEGFEFGINGQHLIFSKPVQLTMGTALEDGAKVEISVKHEGDINFNSHGLSTDPKTECDEQGNTSIPDTNVIVQEGKITFYTCGASVFSVSYVGGANFANFADASIAPGYIDKVVNFAVGSGFPAGSIIKDVNISIDFRPIDSQNPASFGTGKCYPGEKYFRLTSPAGTQVNIINANSLKTPNTNCPRVNLTFDDQAASLLGGNYDRPNGSSWRPDTPLSNFNNQSPFGNRTLRMGDTASSDGVILFGFIITIEVYNPQLCIFSPNQGVIPSFQVKNIGQTWEYQFDYFTVQDLKGSNSGYYTTLQMSNLLGPNNQTIANSQIQRKADPVTLITGTANNSVVLGSSMGIYHLATATDTFIKRDIAPNSNRTGTYGSKLRLKILIPAYTRPGSYSGNIIYTLYEN